MSFLRMAVDVRKGEYYNREVYEMIETKDQTYGVNYRVAEGIRNALRWYGHI